MVSNVIALSYRNPDTVVEMLTWRMLDTYCRAPHMIPDSVYFFLFSSLVQKHTWHMIGHAFRVDLIEPLDLARQRGKLHERGIGRRQGAHQPYDIALARYRCVVSCPEHRVHTDGRHRRYSRKYNPLPYCVLRTSTCIQRARRTTALPSTALRSHIEPHHGRNGSIYFNRNAAVRHGDCCWCNWQGRS